jgi:hypothetical protein
VAFIVIRYFEEVELPALPERTPPPPTALPVPPPSTPPASPEKVELAKWALSLNGGRRVPGDTVDLGGYQAMLTAGVRLAATEGQNADLWLDASAGITGITRDVALRKNDKASGTVSTVRYSAELALLPGWRHGHGRLYAGPVAGLDLIFLDAVSNGRGQSETRVAAAGGIKAGYQYFLAKYLFVRADLAGAVALVRQKIITQSHNDVSATPKAYLTMDLGIGAWF